MSFIEGVARDQANLLPPCVNDYVGLDTLVRVVDAFVDSLDLIELGFTRAIAASTGRPGYHPGDMLRLYIWGYLNQVRSSRHLERACKRDLEAIWLMRQLAPDYRTIAAFRHDYPDAIVAASAAFVLFCRQQNLVGGRSVALDAPRCEPSPVQRTSPGRSGSRAISRIPKKRSSIISTVWISSTRPSRRDSKINRAPRELQDRHRLLAAPEGSAGAATAGTRTTRREGARVWRTRG